MRRHVTNAIYGILDYASYPIGMLLVAPIVLRKLGAAEYGLWMISTSIISAGGIIASGFCDATLQRVAQLRSTNDIRTISDAISSALGVNLLLGSVLACVVFAASPYAAPHIVSSTSITLEECKYALRIAGILILIRSIESIGITTQRAFEQYRGSVQISGSARLLTLASAAILAIFHQHIPIILIATGFFLSSSALVQLLRAKQLLLHTPIRPFFQPYETRFLLNAGIFVWLQALGGVIFGQLDRILLGLFLGATAVAPYSLCVQFAHPLFGAVASGLHFFFPYLSTQAGLVPNSTLRQTVLKAFACNLSLVCLGATLLFLVGDHLLTIWGGADIGQSARKIFPLIVIASALMGLSVTGTYAMQAFGLFKTVALLTLAGRAITLILMLYLLKHMGLRGLATGRVLYGLISLYLYVPLFRFLNEKRTVSPLYRNQSSLGNL
jgi:O-antigen/teichoic acid export membrane protein